MKENRVVGLKNDKIYISLILMFCAFVYLFYRPEKIILTQIVIKIISYDYYQILRAFITGHLELNSIVIYSLPGGLWVFCITYLSRKFILKIGRIKFQIYYLPIVFTLIVELVQFFNLTKGNFDVYDVLLAIVFWSLAILSSKRGEKSQIKVFSLYNKEGAVIFIVFAIVILANVIV